jgi:hypothetical protein
MRHRKAIALLAATLAALLWLLASRPPANSQPEVRLESLTCVDTPTTGFFENADWLPSSSTQHWTATFAIHNPGGRSIGFAAGQAITGVVIVDRDSETITPNAALGDMPVIGRSTEHLRPKESKFLLRVSVPAGSKACRFRFAYWPATARERWGMLCAKWNIAQRYPGVSDWVSIHLPDTRRKLDGVWELRLPSEPFNLRPSEGAHNSGWGRGADSGSGAYRM